ncbi:MAG: response regulator transcription factor [Alicyclobacillus macrosporangiidus]|uniref:response regulator transcription factor n=1 Tax=Alicyclobacillus macrosporangiidus TaxID=392015 RepID=UPI0026EC3C82|nr:response regulator transcription factor [Alicyclobacillus macrosporangiidus]MCL6599240.1 response regulator transcription factor [Alicyclobacillus macrosporangiidus]
MNATPVPSEIRIRVLIADDQRLIRDGLRYIIEAQPDMEVVGETDRGESAVALALKERPDVVLMDIQMPGEDGLWATGEIVRQLPQTKVLLLTTFDVPEYVYDGIRAGAVGYLLKDEDAGALMDAIRAVHRGHALYRTGAAAEVLGRIVRSPHEEPASREGEEMEHLGEHREIGDIAEPLTDRELEVLQEMAWGLRNDEIARKLCISEGTVKTHVHRILQKLGVEDRTQAVVIALRRGIVR